MTKVKTKVPFSGVPVGTTAELELDGDLFKVTWELPNRSKPLVDWFDAEERKRFLEDL